MTDTADQQALDVLRAVHARNWAAAIASSLALCASGVSLWETVLRQAALDVYVGDNIAYTRDPWGSYEVLVVPLTIANTGAQEGAVVAMKLSVRNAKTGQSETFEAAYTAEASYYAGRDSVTERTRRPKSPFAPLSINGRGRFSGTVLFYAAEPREQKIVEPGARIETELTMTIPPPRGWLDRWLAAPPPQPVRLTMDLPNFLPGAVLSGDFARARPATPSTAR